MGRTARKVEGALLTSVRTIGVKARMPILFMLSITLTGCRLRQREKDVATVAKSAEGAVVSIVMLNRNGRPIDQGSGFVITTDGRILTNYHVISSGDSAIVKLPDGAFFPVGGVLSFDRGRDIAVIKASGKNFHTVVLGDSSRVEIGDEVIAIGNPLSLESTVSNGIVSGIRADREKGEAFLQVTTPISPGSSGGPLFNMDGQVVGITTMQLKGGQNLNFAIPINDAKGLLAARTSKVLPFPITLDLDEVSVGGTAAAPPTPEPFHAVPAGRVSHVHEPSGKEQQKDLARLGSSQSGFGTATGISTFFPTFGSKITLLRQSGALHLQSRAYPVSNLIMSSSRY
jgi:S1-C subfamily serine protease